ncbi:MAG: glycosyltransferase family 4 protein [Planctomycetota bacterium]
MQLRILQLNSARKYIGEAGHTLNLTEALRRRGHAVWLGLRAGYDTFRQAGRRGLEPVGFHMPHRWWPPQDLPDIRHIARLVRDNRIDVIHAHRGKDHWQAVLATRLYGLGVPVVRTRHVVTPLSSHAANRWLARRTAALVAVSQAVLDDVRRAGAYAPERLLLIPAGIDLELFAPAGAEKQAAARERLLTVAQASRLCVVAQASSLHVAQASSLRTGGTPVLHAGGTPALQIAVCVARFAVVKAHRVLLAAWCNVAAQLPGARLLLIGDGQLMADCLELAKAEGLEQSVFFLGRREDVPELLDAADVGVLSSVASEGFSRAVLEYMAKGLPVVATRVGAVPDLIEDGVHGLLVPPNDAGALAAALLRVLAEPLAQRLAWGRAARAKAERLYGYETWATAHEELYARLLDRNPS